MAAFRKIAPEAGQATESLFALPQLPSVDLLITPIINNLAALNERLVVVFDDYHLIRNRYIHDMVQFMMDYWSPMLHLVLITREDPPLTLTVIRDEGKLTEIRADDLRFSEEETTAFMNGAMRLDLESEVITLINMMTEGCIAGLQLAALFMRGRTPDDIINFLIDFSSSHRYIIDYLISEVLAGLPVENRDFLLQTAVPDRLCASLCKVITGRRESQQLLELLESSDFFYYRLMKSDSGTGIIISLGTRSARN